MRIPLSIIHGARDELSENTVKTLGLGDAATLEIGEKPPRNSGQLSGVNATPDIALHTC